MIACIVQARMGSKRFPGKVMADLCGHPVLWHVLTRCLKIKGVDRVLLAAPAEAATRAMVPVATACGVSVILGPEDDVLGRYVSAARAIDASTIMRITADCPLINPEVCASVLTLLVQNKLDYAANCHPYRTFPRGLDCEVFNRATLETTAHCALDAYEREHVTPFMHSNRRFLKGSYNSNENGNHLLNYCIDYPEDLPRVAEIMRHQCA